MPICPVCEHVQPDGAECVVCGKKLFSGPAAIPFVPPVEGLEPTLHAPVELATETLIDLEPTRQPEVDAREESALDLDLGRAVAVDVPDEDPVPGLERIGDGAPEDAPTAVPAVPTCRYCRTPALPGERVCARCGMRLPTFQERAEEQGAPPRSCGCGLAVTGPMCPGCGARLS
jgi:hypothetical protein